MIFHSFSSCNIVLKAQSLATAETDNEQFPIPEFLGIADIDPALPGT